MSTKKFAIPKHLIGKNLHLFRKSKGLSLQKLAEKIESSAGYISDVENGKAQPGAQFFYSIRQSFRVDIDFIFRDNDIPVVDKNPGVENEKTDEAQTNDPNIQQIILDKDHRINSLEEDKQELRQDKKQLMATIAGLEKDKERLLLKVQELEKEMAGMEKRQTGS
ncbi:helix-turn-helix domain-containing protein [bacterium]|nr:helix-turn-helix domain-containing protein [bacterium]